MAERFIKSVFWLGSFTALGYGLFISLTPNEESLKKELPGLEPRGESTKKKQQFVDVLQAAANSNKPFYRLDKEGIDKQIKRE